MRRPPTHTLFPYTSLFRSRWKPRQIRLWSLEYVRFWIVKTLIRSNPAPYLFIGSPLYGLYLRADEEIGRDRKSTRLNSSHMSISYAVFCLEKKRDKTLSGY